ncbi:MAG: beta-N-acetylhexosaminidase [Limisphaerales bacterium]
MFDLPFWLRGFVLLAVFLVRPATLAATPAIIPLPQVMQVQPGTFTLCPSQLTTLGRSTASTKILVEPQLRHEGEYLAGQLLRSTGLRFEVSTNASLTGLTVILLTGNTTLTNLGTEGYELTVDTNSVVIRGQAAGVFYGIQTLLQMLPPQIFSHRPVTNVAWTAPCIYIQDKPRFSWRGWMIDSARHFFTKDEIKDYIDAAAMQKLNMFHWHLDDDTAWRIEIKKWPLLTQVGAWRNGIDFTLNPRSSYAFNDAGKYGGFYTQDDIREIVSYATQRHITIVPEIEMPGHSLAALTAYPQFGCGCSTCQNGPYGNLDVINSNGSGVFCPARPETLSFLQDILSEVIDLFPGPYIHIGGDEVTYYNWARHQLDIDLGNSLGIGTSQVYQGYFAQRIANFAATKGRTIVGWSELFNGGFVTNAVLMDWLTGTSSRATFAATNGAKVVMTPTSSCYINFLETSSGGKWISEPPWQSGTVTLATAYSMNPIPAALPAAYTNNILGAQGNCWAEYIPSRVDMEFRAFPRLCALAEVNWTSAALKNYTDFTNRLVIHEQRFDYAGISYNPHADPPVIGSWSSAPLSYSPIDWDVTSSMTAGDFVTSFITTSGSTMTIQTVALLENGVQIDLQTNASTPTYIFRVPGVRRTATYTLRATAQANTTNSIGLIYHPTKWN